MLTYENSHTSHKKKEENLTDDLSNVSQWFIWSKDVQYGIASDLFWTEEKKVI